MSKYPNAAPLRYKHCVIYARVSTEGQIKHGTGLQRQTGELIEFANDTQMHIDGVFGDVCSGDWLTRPALAGALRAAKRADFFLIEDQDRLARDLGVYRNITAYLSDEKTILICYYDFLNWEGVPRQPLSDREFRLSLE